MRAPKWSWRGFNVLSAVGLSLMGLALLLGVFLGVGGAWRALAGVGFSAMGLSVWIGLCATRRNGLAQVVLEAGLALGSTLAATGLLVTAVTVTDWMMAGALCLFVVGTCWGLISTLRESSPQGVGA